ncbi:phospholipase D-like domain-containing protein, partial [Neobacillus cucumis]
DKIKVRWYNTVIGQYHTKLVTVQTADKTYITNGSSNITERTLRDYNLEANLRIIAPTDSELTDEINAYFDRIWNNEDALYTLDVEEYQNSLTFFQRGIYALQRWAKLTSY